MAGGNITRIVGGKHSIETDEWIVHTDKFTAYAGKGSHFTADGGTFLGNPNEAPSIHKYFKKGWWSSDKEGNEKITKAKIGDTVYFQVEMTENFPEEDCLARIRNIINFQLYEFDGNNWDWGFIFRFPARPTLNRRPIKEDKQKVYYVEWLDENDDGIIDENEKKSKKPSTHVTAIGNKAVIRFTLGDGLMNYFNEFAELKLFMSVSYYTDLNINLPTYESLYLDIDPIPPKIQEIYVRLLNYRVPAKIIDKLSPVGGSVQYIHGNDQYMSEKVNMDYFSVKIDKLPQFADNNIVLLYKEIRKYFLNLSKGSKKFMSHNQIKNTRPMVSGKWEFKPYPLDENPSFAEEQIRRWRNELNGTVIFIEAGGGVVESVVGDHGAVLESECEPLEMCWIFTTIITEKSKSQPFSGHRQFGIHKDEEGNYRFFARAIDRIWPSDLISWTGKDDAIKNYLTIADATWNNLIKSVSEFIDMNGGITTIMPPTFVRTDFNKFLSKYKTAPTEYVGNIPQYKEITEDEI